MKQVNVASLQKGEKVVVLASSSVPAFPVFLAVVAFVVYIDYRLLLVNGLHGTGRLTNGICLGSGTGRGSATEEAC